MTERAGLLLDDMESCAGNMSSMAFLLSDLTSRPLLVFSSMTDSEHSIAK